VAVDQFKSNPEPTVMKWDFHSGEQQGGGALMLILDVH